MNPSWRNISNNPSGFVYFNTNAPSQNMNNSDYMSFNNSYDSSMCNTFSPAHSSSPKKFQKSPRNFQGRNSFRYHNNRDSNCRNSSNQSFNTPNKNFNNSWRNNGYQHSKNNSSFNNSGKKDMSVYLDHTCTKDPWAELEEKLKQKQEAEIKSDTCTVDKQNTDVEESSSSSADEQESELETKTSSSELEDGST